MSCKTSAILASILESSALIGAISKDFGSNFRYVNKLIAFEADESDASFLLSNPYCAIVTNAEPEHMEYYHYDYDKFYGSYERFISLAKKRVVNGEDKDIAKLKIEDATYLYPSKDIKNLCYTLKNNQPCTRFDLKDLGTFEVWGFGFHMASNASLAISWISFRYCCLSPDSLNFLIEDMDLTPIYNLEQLSMLDIPNRKCYPVKINCYWNWDDYGKIRKIWLTEK